MGDWFTHAWDDILGRLGGPLSFRFLFQPAVSALIGIIAGVQDAKAGRPAYLLAVFTDSVHRAQRCRECWSAIWKVFLVAVILDVAYEIIVFKTVYPGQTLIVAIVLAVFPYVLVRGPANRITRMLFRSRTK